jgi:DNA polymerase-1
VRLEQNILKQIEPLLGKFYDWFLNKDYPPARSGNFAQGIAEYAQLPLPKTASGKLSLTEKNIQKLPDSIYKQALLKEAYLPEPLVREVQWMLARQEHGTKHLFNLQSKHHLKKLFFDTMGLEPLSRTDLGNPQVDDDFIHSIADQYAWANDLHAYNRLQKLKSTYIERFLEEQVDGIFYPSFFQHRTISGRFGSDLQQLPRKITEKNEPSEVVRKYNNLVRYFFTARPGHKFVGADYESLEPHIFAHVSGDERLQQIFKQGLDFYSEIAIRTEGLTKYSSNKSADNYLGKLAEEKRQTAKSYALGIPYGMSGYKLARELGISDEQADKLVNDYLSAFPDLKKWMDDTQSFVIENGYIRSQAGRVRHMPRAKEYAKKFGLSILDSLHLYKEYGHDPSLYEHMKDVRRQLKNYINNANNFQIQSLAASIVNRAAIAIMREIKSSNLQASVCMNVHDELVVEVADQHLEVVAKIVQKNMENIMPLSLPLKAVPKIATVYGETK